MWIIKGLLGAAICLVMDSAGLNRLCDFVVPVYVVLAVIVFLLFIKVAKKKASDGESVDARIYTYKKKESMANLPWRRRLIGKWEKIHRDPQAFYEVSSLSSQ
jgi:type III secretory pathway component EscV